MPLNEVHGFCYSDNLPNCIVVNSRHPYNARIFTIFHELAHIINNNSGICITEDLLSNQKEELFCNEFTVKTN